MNKLLIVLLLSNGIAGVFGQNAPDWRWATNSGGSGLDAAYDMVCDPDGNTYVTGYYTGWIQFGDFYTDSGGDEEIFVVKLDPDGNYLWAQHAGGEYNDSPKDIAIDAAGNVYITGTFVNVATFGSLGVVSNGHSDIFIAKLSHSGEWLWVWGAGGEQGDTGTSITVNSEGHCFVAGSYYEEAYFGDHSIECDFMSDMFIAETNADGNWIWVQQAGGPHVEACWDMVADDEGNCYLTGFISDDTDFGSTHMDTEGPYDSFVAKINDGDWIWAVQVASGQMDVAHGIDLDATGNLVVTGYFTGPADFGGTILTPAGECDIYLAKISPSGNWIWAAQAGGEDYDFAYDVVTDQWGNCYVTGQVYGWVDFGPNIHSYGSLCNALFVAKADPDGNWLWLRRTVSWDGSVGMSVAVDAAGRSYVCGALSGQEDFGDIILTSNGAGDVLIAGLAANPVPVDDPSLDGVPGCLLMPSPNPARMGDFLDFKLSLSADEAGTLQLFNSRGQLIFTRELPPGVNACGLDSHSLQPGIYLCRLRSGKKTQVSKLVLLP